jgi:thymidylate synthase
MRTHFNMFLRLFEPRAAFSHSWLLYHFDEVFSDKNITEFCEKKKINEEIFMNCLDELDKLAKNTHTIGNYMPCPDETYNAVKGYNRGFVVFNDRIELLIKELKMSEHSDYINPNCADKWEEWFDENVKKLRLEGLFKGDFNKIENSYLNDSLLAFPIHKKLGQVYKFECEEIESFKNYLQYVNKWIVTRGEDLLNDTK